MKFRVKKEERGKRERDGCRFIHSFDLFIVDKRDEFREIVHQLVTSIVNDKALQTSMIIEIKESQLNHF